MKLQQLRYFEAACRLGSVSRAAESLQVSQPSVSMAIRELEREFRVVLTVKRYQGFELTEEGRLFYELSGSLLRHAEHVSEQMCLCGQRRRPVRLGIPPMVGTVLLPSLYSAIRRQGLDILLSTEELGTKALLHNLRENGLDMAFISHSLPVEGGFSSVPIAEVEIVWCAPRDHFLAGRPQVSVQELEGEPLVLFNDSFFVGELLVQQFSEAGIAPDILHTTAQLSTVQSLIHSGAATGFLLRPMAETMPGIVFLPLSPPLLIHVSLVWKQKPFRDMERVIDLCRTLLL